MSSAFVVIAVAIGFVCIYMGKTKSEFSYLLMQNVEALAKLESWKDCGDPKYTPNGSIDVEQIETSVVANSNGELHILENTFAGYDAGKEYVVLYAKKNCKEWDGACCDQTDVGISVVSAKKR